MNVALLICLSLLGGCGFYPDPALGIDGGCAPTNSPFLKQDDTVAGRISFCEGADAWIGTLESRPYPPGTKHIEVMLTGYPGNPGVSLNAVTRMGKTARIAIPEQPREHWERFMLVVPDDIAQEGYRIRIDDQSRSSFGWAGLGDSITRSAVDLAGGCLSRGQARPWHWTFPIPVLASSACLSDWTASSTRQAVLCTLPRTRV